MKDAHGPGSPLFSFRKKSLLAPPVLFLLLALASPLAAQTPSDPAYVHDGPGADVTWWNSSTTAAANWGRSNFGGLTTGLFHSYVLNQTLAGPDPAGGTSGQQPASSNPPTSISIGWALTEGQTYYWWIQANNSLAASAWVHSNGFTVDTVPPVV
jgi:hypothetical protein